MNNNPQQNSSTKECSNKIKKPLFTFSKKYSYKNNAKSTLVKPIIIKDS